MSSKKVETDEERKARYDQPTEHFYWLGLINSKKPHRGLEELDHYNAFMVNKGLSYYQECIGPVNQINQLADISNRMQFDWLYHMIPKGKRFAKWIKPEKESVVELIKEVYNVSRAVAREYSEILNSLDDKDVILKELEERISRGGRMQATRNT